MLRAPKLPTLPAPAILDRANRDVLFRKARVRKSLVVLHDIDNHRGVEGSGYVHIGCEEQASDHEKRINDEGVEKAKFHDMVIPFVAASHLYVACGAVE